MSQKRPLTGNFRAKIFEPKFNTFINIITTILEVQFVWGFLRHGCIMQVSISSITIPPGQVSGTRLEGSKNPPPGTSFCTKTLHLGQYRESKAPHPGHEVRKFHKCIYKLLTLFETKSFVDSTNKTVFQWRDLIIKVYVIWRSPESNYSTYKSFI